GGSSYRRLGRLVCWEIRAQVVDKPILIGGVNECAPLDHFVDFLGPGYFAETLLQNDARIVALRACRGHFGLCRACGKAGRLRRSDRSTKYRNRETQSPMLEH